MIDSKDLRIGNYVNSKPLGSNHRITGLLNDMLYTDLQLSYSEYEDWQPIELTPEILEKCGFDKGILWNEFQINQELRFYADIDEVVCHLFDKQDHNITVIKYVHQLQNLYFALTGEELKVVW